MLGALLLLGLFSTGLSLVCDTCHDKCSCLNRAVAEECPPMTFCYTVTNFLNQPIRKGCSEDCTAFSGQCTRCANDYCNKTPRGAYTPSGYEDCDNSGSGIGGGAEYGGGSIGGGATYGGDSGIGRGAGFGGGSGIGQGGTYGGGSGIGQGAGVNNGGGGVYGGNQGGIGQGAGFDPYNQERYGGGQYGQGQGAIGTGAGYNQPRAGIGRGVYPKASSATVLSSFVAVLGAVCLMA